MNKNKVLEVCYPSLWSFLLERDQRSLDEVIKLGDQFAAAHSGERLQKETIQVVSY